MKSGDHFSITNELSNHIPTPSYSTRAVNATEALFSIGYLLLKCSVEFSWWVMKSLAPTSKPTDSALRLSDHEKQKQKLLKQFHQKEDNGQLALGGKATSYLFRPRHQLTTKLNMSRFNKVLSIDPSEKIANVGGMTTFYELVNETLKLGLLPEVVPELRGITVGGGVAGIAIESSSFKYGLLHNSVIEMEVLTGKGELHTCNSHNAHSDLFYGMPNSYGTLGYAISMKIKLITAGPFVKLEHIKFENPNAFFNAIEISCNANHFDFIDGAIFSPTQMVMTRGIFVEHAPYTNNYRQKGIYYQSMQTRNEDYLTTSDYIWRWDADSFWSTEKNGKPTILQNQYVRDIFGNALLRSDRLKILGKIADEFHKNVVKFIDAIFTNQTKHYEEDIIQDVGIPIQNCTHFVKWLDENIGLYPLFVCPTRDPHSTRPYPLWAFNEGKLACDIGIFHTKRTQLRHEKNYFNRLLEREVEKQNGKKSLYSQVFFNKPDFEQLYYGGDAYAKLKKQYDPSDRFPTLYEKCVLNR